MSLLMIFYQWTLTSSNNITIALPICSLCKKQVVQQKEIHIQFILIHIVLQLFLVQKANQILSIQMKLLSSDGIKFKKFKIIWKSINIKNNLLKLVKMMPHSIIFILLFWDLHFKVGKLINYLNLLHLRIKNLGLKINLLLDRS